jgi:branched-chain amino acid transport system substrate-binding protein
MRINALSFVGAALSIALAAHGASAQVKIGIGGPVTGANAAFGAQLVTGAQQAIADINGAGGILGQTVEGVPGDDAADPKQGVSVANKFVGEGIRFVVGHFNSGVSIPASEVYAENGVLEISPASTNPNFTDRHLWNAFRTCGRDDQQGVVAGGFIASRFKGKNVVILHDKTTYGKGLADETKANMNKLGVKEVMYEGVNTGEKDFSALVAKIKGAKADLVYWGGLHTELGLIIRQMRDQGITAAAMGADGITSDEFAAIGGDGVIGTFMTFPPDPRNRPTAAEIVKRFQDKGFNPEAYTLYSYAAVQLIKLAAEEAKSLDPKKVADALHSGKTFRTVLGDIAYDAKGDRKSLDYVLYTWQRGADGKITYKEMQ